jgi:myo-inositol-1(or 4)-monophosphatase
MNTLTELISSIKEALPEVLSLRTLKEKKDDDSYVSKGDLLMDDLIISFLKKKYSSVQIITEETYQGGEVNIHATEYIAVVDPIDGTENFVSGLKEWGSGICIYKNGTFDEALIALPELNQYLHSSDAISKLYDSRIYGISSSLSKEDILNLETGFEYRIIGCCMYNMYNVLTGSYKQFQNPKGAKCWDILPGLNLALQHKLHVTVNDSPYHGEFLQATSKYRFLIKNL